MFCRGVYAASRCCIRGSISPNAITKQSVAFGGVKMSGSKNIRKKASVITVLSMLTAISVVVGIVCKNLFTVAVYYRFTLENIGVIFVGIFFGPTAGVLVGVAVDVISCVLSSNPALNPIITVGAVAVGAISGIVSRYIVKEHGMRQFVLADAVAHLFGQVLIKSVAKMIYFGMPWYGIFIGALCSALACAAETVIIRALWKNREVHKFLLDLTGEKEKEKCEVGALKTERDKK